MRWKRDPGVSQGMVIPPPFSGAVLPFALHLGSGGVGAGALHLGQGAGL